MSEELMEQKIIEVFNELEEEHELKDSEKQALATIISLVAQSSDNTRLFFYSEVAKTMEEIRKRLDKRKREVLDILMGNKKKSIVN
jgi:hypothetical protein